MKIPAITVGATLVSALALSLPVQGQQSSTQTQQAETPSDGSECLERLDVLGQRMNEEGYWLAGYSGGYGTDAFGNRVPTDSTAGGTPPGATSPGTPRPADPTRPGVAGGTSPWTGVTWTERPHYQIRTLFQAANVLAASGDEEACMTVVNAVEHRYDDYIEQLRDLGVEPQEITNWRQAEIATAVPVSETNFPRRVDDLIGADVRNVQDEDLGDIDDVVLDPQTGNVEYVIVSRGGFFGIGSEEVAVPLEHLRVAPGMTTFVLPVNEAEMEQAPQVAQENDVDPGQTRSVQQDKVDSYWRDTVDR